MTHENGSLKQNLDQSRSHLDTNIVIHKLKKSKFFLHKIVYILAYPSSVLGAQKNRLNETVLLSTHNTYLVEK